MTREEAKEIIKNIDRAYRSFLPCEYEALEMAIKTLEQNSCADCISRQAVLNTLDNMDNVLDEDRTVETYKMLLTECVNVLPPVTPTENPNKWIPANQPPKASGRYIVTRHFFNNDFVEMANYGTDLRKVDKYDFPKHKAGWYDSDSEYGYYELDDIVAWMPRSEPYKASPTGEVVEE